MDKVLILGGKGFLGTHISACFQSPTCSVCSIGSKDLDLLKTKDVREFMGDTVTEVTTVIYAAGIPRLKADTTEALLKNIQAVTNVLDAFAECRPKKFIYLSSAEVYGVHPSLPITEENSLDPMTLYASGKVCCEQIVTITCDSLGIPAAILRFPGTYGEHDRSGGFIASVANCLKNGELFILRSPPETIRDYVFAPDLARVVWHITEKKFAETVTVNIATGTGISLGGIIETMSSIFGKKLLVQREITVPRRDLIFDNSELMRNFPGCAFTSFRDGMQHSHNYYAGSL